MRHVDVERGAVDPDDRLDHAARLANARQRMNDRGDDLAAREDGVAEVAAETAVAASVVAVHPRQPPDLFVLVAKSHLPRVVVDFLQPDDVRLELSDRRGDLRGVIGVVQLVMAFDVVGHDDERPLLPRKADPIGKRDKPSRLVARQDADLGIDRLRPALARTDGVDREDTVKNEEQDDRKDPEDRPPHRCVIRHCVLSQKREWCPAGGSTGARGRSAGVSARVLAAVVLGKMSGSGG